MKSNRRPFLSFFLVAFVLIAQLGALAHGLEHGFEQLAPQNQQAIPALDGGHTNDQTLDAHGQSDGVASCLTCLSYASVGSGARCEALPEHATPPAVAFARWHVRATVTSLTPQQHRARAPPLFS